MRGKTADEARAGMKGMPEEKLNHILPHKVKKLYLHFNLTDCKSNTPILVCNIGVFIYKSRTLQLCDNKMTIFIQKMYKNKGQRLTEETNTAPLILLA